MSDTRSQQEPSMEEILASIRRIISEDNEPEAPAPMSTPAFRPEPEPAAVREEMDEDVLELTQMVKDDGSVVDVRDDDDDDRGDDRSGWDDEPEPEPQIDMDNLDDFFDRPSEPPPRVDPAPRPPVSAARAYDDEDLVSGPTAAATSAAFAHLASSLGSPGMAVHAGGPTIEDIVKELLRPMLRSWLDENLPPTVERLVQREIEKMVRRAQGG
jgi:cell pole-organizing protein PopZ